jgi:hypothetical protein
MSKEALDFTLPSNPADRKKIKEAVYEIVSAMQEAKDKRSFISDTKKLMKEEFGIPPKILSKMAKTYSEANFQDVLAESETFELTYENLFETSQNQVTVSGSDDE